MTSKRKSDYSPHIPPEQAPACGAPGCPELGMYKAPRSREQLNDYHWLCLDHIREHNRQWDYFSGMERDEIEYFIKDAMTGHRPTWNRENGTRHQPHKLHDALYEFLSMDQPRRARPTPPLSAKLRRALAVMDLEYPYTAEELKTQYRLLVKKHHPDMNRGEKQSEELFKKVTAAHQCLMEHLKSA